MKTTIVTSNRTIVTMCITSGGVLMHDIKESHEGRYNQHNRRYSQRLYAAIDKCLSGLLDYTSTRVSNGAYIYYCNLINDSLFSSPSSFSLAVSGLVCRRCAEMFARAGYCWTTRCGQSRCLKHSLELAASNPPVSNDSSAEQPRR